MHALCPQNTWLFLIFSVLCVSASCMCCGFVMFVSECSRISQSSDAPTKNHSPIRPCHTAFRSVKNTLTIAFLRPTQLFIPLQLFIPFPPLKLIIPFPSFFGETWTSKRVLCVKYTLVRLFIFYILLRTPAGGSHLLSPLLLFLFSVCCCLGLVLTFLFRERHTDLDFWSFCFVSQT